MANALLIKTEIRGDHATGFWACERGNNKIFYDKEPIKSTNYCHTDIWKKQFASSNTDLLIAHCRYTSINVGHEKYNKNNHPHASSDRRVALVHNGKIPEYGALKSRYELKSDCDSEILLSMFEAGEEYKNKEDFLKQEFPTIPTDIAHRMMGLKEVFSRVNYGAMAVAIGERGEDTTSRFLWLFADEHRPLHVVDLRKTIGQIFFCSTMEIWKSSVDACPSIKQYIPSDHRIIEFPPYQVWMFSTNQAEDADADNWRLKKYRITKTKFYDWKQEDDSIKIPRPRASKPIADIITRLDYNEEIKNESKVETENKGPVPSLNHTVTKSFSKKKVTTDADKEADVNDYGRSMIDEEDVLARHAASSKDEALEELSFIEPLEIDMETFDNVLEQLRNLLNNVETVVKNQEKEQSLSTKDFGVIMESLKDVHSELKGSLIFIKP